MKKVKSAKKSMLVFMVHDLLKKVEYINFDYVGMFAMFINIFLLVGTLFFNFASNVDSVFFIFVATLFLFPLFALIEKLIQSILNSFYN